MNSFNKDVRTPNRPERARLDVLAKAAIDNASEAYSLNRRTERRLLRIPGLVRYQSYSVGELLTLIVVQARMFDYSLARIFDIQGGLICLAVFNGEVAQNYDTGLVEVRKRPFAI